MEVVPGRPMPVFYNNLVEVPFTASVVSEAYLPKVEPITPIMAPPPTPMAPKRVRVTPMVTEGETPKRQCLQDITNDNFVYDFQEMDSDLWEQFM